MPLGGASGNMPVIGSCRVSNGSPAGREVRVQKKILVGPDVVLGAGEKQCMNVSETSAGRSSKRQRAKTAEMVRENRVHFPAE